MASDNPVVRDLVIPLEDFPHLNENQTLHDAVEVLLSYKCGEYDRIRYAEILILNDRNQLTGRVTLQIAQRQIPHLGPRPRAPRWGICRCAGR